MRLEPTSRPHTLHRRWAHPGRLGLDRQLQCVSPSGLDSWVNRTISSIFSAGICGLRPRPGRTRPSLASPSSAKRLRQATTLDGETPTSQATAVLPVAYSA
jgi:hypothetical protein